MVGIYIGNFVVLGDALGNSTVQLGNPPSRHTGDHGASFSQSNTSGIFLYKTIQREHGLAHGGWLRNINGNDGILNLTIVLGCDF